MSQYHFPEPAHGYTLNYKTGKIHKPSLFRNSLVKLMSKPKKAQRKINIEGQGISRTHLSELKNQLKDRLEDVGIKQTGNKLVLTPNKESSLSKSKIKVYLKKFLHQQQLKKLVRLRTGGIDTIRLYRPGYVEEESK